MKITPYEKIISFNLSVLLVTYVVTAFSGGGISLVIFLMAISLCLLPLMMNNYEIYIGESEIIFKYILGKNLIIDIKSIKKITFEHYGTGKMQTKELIIEFRKRKYRDPYLMFNEKKLMDALLNVSEINKFQFEIVRKGI